MAEEANTPDPSQEIEQIVNGTVVQTRAEAAYELKLQGKKLSAIADELGFASTGEVAHAISSIFKMEAQYLTLEDRTSRLQMEMDRLDRLQSVLWPSAMTGDPKSVEAVLRVMDRRIRMLGLDALDTTSHTQAVLVVGGDERAYVAKLKELNE